MDLQKLGDMLTKSMLAMQHSMESSVGILFHMVIRMVESESSCEEENWEIVSKPGPPKMATDGEMLADDKPASQAGDETVRRA